MTGTSSYLSPCIRELMDGENQYKDKSELPSLNFLCECTVAENGRTVIRIRVEEKSSIRVVPRKPRPFLGAWFLCFWRRKYWKLY